MALRKRNRRDEDGFWGTGLSAENIHPDTPYPLKIKGETLIVTRIDEAIYAFSAACPHAAADLTKGTLHRGRITCPLHEWKFDIRTGRTRWPEDETCRLQRFETRIRDGEVRVKIS